MAKKTQENGEQERAMFVCVAPGCTNNSVNTRNIGFHSFPEAQSAVERWLAALGKVTPPSSSMETVCSKHFWRKDFLDDQRSIIRNLKTRTLKPEAVPSIFAFLQTNTLEQEKKESPEEEDEDDVCTDATLTEAAKPYRPRVDKALGQFTQMFMKALNSTSNGILDIKDAARIVGTSKRRIYDITNVLEGISLIKKPSKNLVMWVGWPMELKDDVLSSLVSEEKRLDDLIRNAKKQIEEMYENLLNNRLAYVTYEDIQSLPIFEDQAVFVVRGPPETKLEVAHPKEAFQIHINSETGPVEVLVCTDNLDISNQSQRPKFDDGDYSYVPLRGISTTAVSCKDNANDNKTKNNTTSNSSTELSQQLSQPLNSPPKSTCVLPLLEDQLNSSPPSPPVVLSIKEELIDMNIMPDKHMNFPVHEPDQLATDVQMTDLS
ncbi:transcription factor E2F3 [Boleophthalmus pectinirostris]|uniref:transcription factor E2F3 n=1 Tax=Boleophthalmus pectinirostris TaxID=150288 RepID=UPI00242B1839|nr:transcription factor E2F3 [Boleophthalmus pectinirostris]